MPVAQRLRFGPRLTVAMPAGEERTHVGSVGFQRRAVPSVTCRGAVRAGPSSPPTVSWGHAEATPRARLRPLFGHRHGSEMDVVPSRGRTGSYCVKFRRYIDEPRWMFGAALTGRRRHKGTTRKAPLSHILDRYGRNRHRPLATRMWVPHADLRNWQYGRRFGEGTNVFALRYNDQYHVKELWQETSCGGRRSPAVNLCGWTKATCIYPAKTVKCMQRLRSALT